MHVPVTVAGVVSLPLFLGFAPTDSDEDDDDGDGDNADASACGVASVPVLLPRLRWQHLGSMMTRIILVPPQPIVVADSSHAPQQRH